MSYSWCYWNWYFRHDNSW